MRTRPGRPLPVAVAAAALAAVAVLPALPAHADTPRGPASARAVPAPEHPSYIVTVHEGLDPAVVAEAYGIRPTHVYRDAGNGFAARLSPDQVRALRDTPVVESVEEDGEARGVPA
ncbi:protease inhibitor I9 family protein [Streptomyces sp. NPDC012794]|uniref:protease inhibitor I9 family protein n=1 Tax=Streptomyces sp. NPDC012794 TaxID=3364850 RepID=UPI003676D837